MRVRLFVSPIHGATYADHLRLAHHAEELGFDGYFRADHYQALSGRDEPPGATDAWTTLAGLARETTRIRLGTLVTSATFRLPGPLSVVVTQVDQMSGGRIELGLGAGWFEPEHLAYGIPFPPDGERLDRLEEQLQILLGLWSAAPDGRYSFRGKYYELVDASSPPQPAQRPHPPIIVGGQGRVRTPLIAARYGDEYNLSFQSVANTVRQYHRVQAACERVDRAATGRVPLVYSANVMVACGRTEAELAPRVGQMQASSPRMPEEPIFGPPDHVVERIEAYREAGAEVIYLNTVNLHDLGHLDLLAEQVLPQVVR